MAHGEYGDAMRQRELFCEGCREVTSFEGDGAFFYCLQCGLQSSDITITDADILDTVGESEGGSGLYNPTLSRRVESQPHIPTTPDDNKPRDFAVPLIPLHTAAVASAMRERYVQGLQNMMQCQIKALVTLFDVSPFIIDTAASVWFPYLAASAICKDGWDTGVLAKLPEDVRSKPPIGKSTTIFILRLLKESVPLYSTLVVSFLACHLAHMPVLPTDIIDWVLEGRLPYLSFFVQVDDHIGPASPACPLRNRTMFRPSLVLGSWQLEVAAAQMAKKIGLELPPVDFNALARRWLTELTLPMEILIYARRVYEWIWPVETWINASDFSGYPTRVVLMSILIITFRIRFNINGYSEWENTISAAAVATKEGPEQDATMDSGQTSQFDATDLLKVLEAVGRDIEVTHDHPKDVSSYLKYCNDVIFAEMTPDSSLRVNKTIHKLSEIYDKNKDESDIKLGNLNSDWKDVGGKRHRDDVSGSTSFEESTHQNPDNYEKKCSWHKGVVDSSKRGEKELDMLRFEMEENGFHYCAPVSRSSKGYISYKRENTKGMLVYVVHADYYIMLRTLAKVVRVDMRLLHSCTLSLERKLVWLEEKIAKSLNVPRNQREGGSVEHRECEEDPGSSV